MPPVPVAVDARVTRAEKAGCRGRAGHLTVSCLRPRFVGPSRGLVHTRASTSVGGPTTFGGRRICPVQPLDGHSIFSRTNCTLRQDSARPPHVLLARHPPLPNPALTTALIPSDKTNETSPAGLRHPPRRALAKSPASNERAPPQSALNRNTTAPALHQSPPPSTRSSSPADGPHHNHNRYTTTTARARACISLRGARLSPRRALFA